MPLISSLAAEPLPGRLVPCASRKARMRRRHFRFLPSADTFPLRLPGRLLPRAKWQPHRLRLCLRPRLPADRMILLLLDSLIVLASRLIRKIRKHRPDLRLVDIGMLPHLVLRPLLSDWPFELVQKYRLR